jgi:TetR/AcrR family tetracycline transcriptional repressor
LTKCVGWRPRVATQQVKTQQALIDTIIGVVDTDDLPTDPRGGCGSSPRGTGRRCGPPRRRPPGRRRVHRNRPILRVADAIVASRLDAGYPEPDAAQLCWSSVCLSPRPDPGAADPHRPATTPFTELLDTGAYPALAKVGVDTMLSLDAGFR